MSNLTTGKDVKRPPIEMPPLPPEPQESAPIEQQAQDATITQGQFGVGSQGGGEDVRSTEQAQEMVDVPKQEESNSGRTDPRESAQARNFRELREKEARTARERDDFAQRVKELESRLAQKQDEFNIAPDDLVEGKHLAQVVKELREQKEMLKAYDQQRQFAEAEIRAASRYSDFRNVVNPQTIEAFKAADPRKAEALRKMAAIDQEEALAMAYMYIKDMNLAPTEQRPNIEAQKAQQNSAKPRPLNTVAAQHTDSPISRMNAFAAGEFTEEARKQAFKEMQEARKGY